MNIHNILNQIQRAETDFLQTEFMAPILPCGQVCVRIAGLVATLNVVGTPMTGWAILKPVSIREARVVAKPSLRQIRDYLGLFPAVRLLLLEKDETGWMALPAFQSDHRWEIEGVVPVQLASSVQPFQRILTRFDGSHFWFQEVDRRRNPTIAAYLREALAHELPPDELHKPTLTLEESQAYAALYRAKKQAKRNSFRHSLVDAVAHAGAEFVSYLERDDVYTVTFNVDGKRHHAAVHKNDFSLLSAGICLSGEDQKFDLQSLVGVIREGAKKDLLYIE